MENWKRKVIYEKLPGLNLVGWNNMSDSISALSSIERHYNYVARRNAAGQKFEVYEQNVPDELNHFDMMKKKEILHSSYPWLYVDLIDHFLPDQVDRRSD